jgi:hypothetical protein
MGGRRGGGEYNGECLFDDDHGDKKYDNDDKYDSGEDGKGLCGGADNGGESDYDGRDVIRGPSFGSAGHRTSIIGPHAAAAVINDDNDNNPHRGGGALCPLPPVHPISPDDARCCQCRQPRFAERKGRGCNYHEVDNDDNDDGKEGK